MLGTSKKSTALPAPEPVLMMLLRTPCMEKLCLLLLCTMESPAPVNDSALLEDVEQVHMFAMGFLGSPTIGGIAKPVLDSLPMDPVCLSNERVG